MKEKHVFPIIAILIHKKIVLLQRKYQISEDNMDISQ